LYRISKNTWKPFDVKSHSQQHKASYICHGKQAAAENGYVTFLWMISNLPFKLDTIEQHKTSPYVSFIFVSQAKEQEELEEIKYLTVLINRLSDFLWVLVSISSITVPPVLWLKLWTWLTY
jgi:hypothetical protein